MVPQGVGYGDGRNGGFNMAGPPLGGRQPVNGLAMQPGGGGFQGVDAQAAYQAAYQVTTQLYPVSHVPFFRKAGSSSSIPGGLSGDNPAVSSFLMWLCFERQDPQAAYQAADQVTI